MNTKLILAIAVALIPNSDAADKPAPFVPRMTTLRGASLQPSAGLRAAELQAAQGTEPSADYAGRAPITTRPMSEAEWRRIFPRRTAAK